jgi:hypothetical protein
MLSVRYSVNYLICDCPFIHLITMHVVIIILYTLDLVKGNEPMWNTDCCEHQGIFEAT